MLEHTGPSLPPPPPLRGAEVGSFAHDTVVRRLPAIGRRVPAENDLTPAAAQALDALVAELPDGPVRPLRDPGASDLTLWDGYVAPYVGQSWLEAPWFFAETYFYRRVLEATGYFQPGPGRLADPYARQKALGLEHAGSLPAYPLGLAEAIEGALWGNQADLSLWPAGEGGGPGGAHLLADDTAAAVAHLDTLAAGARVDIVLDNAGAELAHDLVLAGALLAHGLRVALHAKAHPTFVSDALEADVRATVAWLAARPGDAGRLGAALGEALTGGRLTLGSDWFWTSPLEGWRMPARLREELAGAGLVISKGDANYRRWLGDRPWPHATPLAAALAYAPAPLLLLRTCKSEVAAGLDPARAAEAEARDPLWRTSGRWGLIQLGP
jgi:hypothetical protein